MSSPSPTPSIDHKETDDDRQSSSESESDTNPAKSKAKGKETIKDDSESSPSDPTSSSTSPPPPSSDVISAGTWQAIFSPQHNTYYFHNSSTGETTWVNPLQPTSETQDTGAGENTDGQDENVNPNPYDPNSLEARAIAAGIDPSLAHLDPSLVAGSSSLAPSGTFTAKFNARTGTFTATNARAPSHLSEYERMKRMSEFYFDMNAWEKEVEQRDEDEKEAGGKKRKRPTKKDLERFKEQKKLKKIAKTAWLRT